MVRTMAIKRVVKGNISLEIVGASASDAIDIINKAIEQVPEEYRDSAFIDMVSQDYGHGGDVEIYVSWLRPETREEEQERLARKAYGRAMDARENNKDLDL